MKSIDQVNFKDKKTLVRVDYNVPLSDKQEVEGTMRIERTLPTVKKIVNDGGIAILMSHLGRPKGEIVATMSLRHIVDAVSKVMGQKVVFLGDVLDDDIEEKVSKLKAGDIGLLENLRFHKEETDGNPEFAKKIARLGDVYVNDAFGAAHRAHASTSVIAQFFPGKAFAGYLLYNEVANLKKALVDCARPFTVIIGGSKISTKIEIIESLLDRVDNLILTGGMCYTFLKAFGEKIGNSLYEEDELETAMRVLKSAYRKGVNLILPVDSVCGDQFTADASVIVTSDNTIPDGWMGLDIGPKTIAKFSSVIRNSETILWNGPAGVFEFDKFSHGTKSLALCIAAATVSGAFSIVGGGDTITAINKYGFKDFISYISTGGGAMLEYLEGKTLPGIEALEEN